MAGKTKSLGKNKSRRTMRKRFGIDVARGEEFESDMKRIEAAKAAVLADAEKDKTFLIQRERM